MRPRTVALPLILAAIVYTGPAVGTTRHELIRNGGFEAGSQGWVLSGDFQADGRFDSSLSGSAYAYLATPAGDAAASLSGSLEQPVRIPEEATNVTLSFWYSVSSYGRGRLDAMHVTVLDGVGEPLETVAVLTSLQPSGPTEYRYVEHDISRYRGQPVRVRFGASTDASGRTSFRVDDVSLAYEVETPMLVASARDSVAPAPVYSTPEEAGLAAEMAGDWEAALGIYEPLLERQPDRIDLWIRVAEIEAVSGRWDTAAAALGQAGTLSPEDPALHFRRSRALAAADRPQEALAAVQQALSLDPGNIQYLRSQAQLANWCGDTQLALDSHEEILETLGTDQDAERGRARAEAWLGAVDQAVAHYEEYLERYPDDAHTYLEYARAQGWRGNFAEGLEALDEYASRFDPTDEYLADRARLLVGAQRPNAALSLLSPLLETSPADPWIKGTYALALAGSGRPQQALDELHILDELYPDKPETATIRQVVTTPLRSLVRPIIDAYSDSDSVDRFRFGLEGSLQLAPTSHLSASLFTGESQADVGSGLAAPDGRETISTDGIWLQLDQRVGRKAMLSLRGGAAEVEGRDTETTYRLGLRLEPADAVTLELSRERDLYGVSPRSLALGVRRDVSRGSLRWSPAPRYWLDFILSYEEFSDTNRRREVIIGSRREVARRARFNLDLGLRGWWFAFDRDLGNGYYAPTDFERYSLLGYFYWKISDDRGVALSLTPGFLKDETMGSFEFSADATFELTIGIYRAWMLVLRASATENGRAQTGAFSATSSSILLTRRF